MYDPQDLDSNAKDFVSGYALEALDITSEETCLLGLKVREMKDDVKNIICSVTKTRQKVVEKVRMCFTPPRTLRISRLKSQILKPTFLSEM